MIAAGALRWAVQLAKLASDPRSPFSYLRHGLIRSAGGEASLTATTLTTRLEVRFPCEDEVPIGCLDLGALYKRCPPKGEVELALEEDPETWWLRAGRRSLRVPSLQPRDFPAGTLAEKDLSVGAPIASGPIAAAGEVEYDPEALLAALRHVRRAAHEGDERPHLACVLLDPEGLAVATDGDRMHLAGGLPRVAGDPERTETTWRVPVEAVDVVLGVADKLKNLDEVRLECGRGVLRWHLRAGDVRAVASCRAGESLYVPWRSVVPDVEGIAPVSTDGPALLAELDALRRAGAGDLGLLSVRDGSLSITLFENGHDLRNGHEDARLSLPCEGRLDEPTALYAYQVRDALRSASGRVELRVAEHGVVVLELGDGRRMVAARVVTDKKELERLRASRASG